MCIIVYKPANIQLPDYNTLANCFDSNPDGAGLMYRDNNSNQIIIQKGFMSFNSLYTAIQSLQNEIDITAADIILHFRYATQGSISPCNCHPFPITKKTKDLKELKTSSKIAMVHNGVINFCTDYQNKNKKTAVLSDTQIFIRDYLSKMNNSTLFNSAVLQLIEESTNSKFIFMDAKHIELIGDFIEDRGIYYSNSTYKNSRWSSNSKRNKSKNEVMDYCNICMEYTVITDEYNCLCENCYQKIME